MSWFRPTARLLAFAAICAGLLPTAARAVEPITIGFDIELTGGIAPLGKASLLAIQIWTEEINARGGLLSRPVKLIFYDDQSNPALVPGIVTKLLDVDKVDVLLGEVGTNMIAPAMPMVMERHLTFISLFGNDVNSNFHYQNYFSMNPVGGETPRNALSQGFFAVAEMMDPKPQTVALVGADAEFGKNALEGARANAKQTGLKIVYDQTYPPATTDYSSIIRSIQGTNPDLVYVGAYPPDSVGIVRAANEIGLRTRMFGGSMVGLWSTTIKMQLGPLLNGIVNFETWQPVKSLATPEALAFLQKYQARAVAAGVDPLGYSVPPFAYSRMQVLGQAIEGVGSLDQAKLTDYLRNHTFDTVAGGITFGPNGEWTEPRVLAVQFQGVAGHDLDQFKDPKTEVVLWPPALQTGSPSYPYTEVKR
jgi:branched-chain amino acid transport system substrate-binding protein